MYAGLILGTRKVLRPYRRAALLILGEFGYLVPEPETGPVLYELISERYEKKATIITSNKSLTEWGKIIQDNSLASALLDRLMHHGEVYYLTEVSINNKYMLS
ncbi:MAG: ATP-binding protein [Candidatus Eremiobacterota bacterium]